MNRAIRDRCFFSIFILQEIITLHIIYVKSGKLADTLSLFVICDFLFVMTGVVVTILKERFLVYKFIGYLILFTVWQALLVAAISRYFPVSIDWVNKVFTLLDLLFICVARFAFYGNPKREQIVDYIRLPTYIEYGISLIAGAFGISSKYLITSDFSTLSLISGFTIIDAATSVFFEIYARYKNNRGKGIDIF
ncbi:hypothetical protein [Oscillibacter sp.]|uniref:hypothetical protein n=1 Tax=Oscillibacter sp. TaxID=1945593 RepID=UPI003398BE86